jgi:hypothetical protein
MRHCFETCCIEHDKKNLSGLTGDIRPINQLSNGLDYFTCRFGLKNRVIGISANLRVMVGSPSLFGGPGDSAPEKDLNPLPGFSKVK